MIRATARLIVLVALAMILISALAGCSKFKAKKRLHLAPFAEDMKIDVMGIARKAAGGVLPI